MSLDLNPLNFECSREKEGAKSYYSYNYDSCSIAVKFMRLQFAKNRINHTQNDFLIFFIAFLVINVHKDTNATALSTNLHEMMNNTRELYLS